MPQPSRRQYEIPEPDDPRLTPEEASVLQRRADILEELDKPDLDQMTRSMLSQMVGMMNNAAKKIAADVATRST